MQLPSALRALNHRNYKLFFAGQLISLIGTWMQSVGEMWLVYRLSHSSLLLGGAGYFALVLTLVLLPFGGMLADTRDRRKILVGTQTSAMILAGILAALTPTGVVRIWHVFTLAALLGIVNAVDIPTRQAFVADLVKRDDLMNAIALNSSMFNASRVVGPAVAGILVTTVGEGWCFALNGLSYIAVIAGLIRIDARRTRDIPEGPPLQVVIEGFKFVAGSPPIHVLLALVGMISLAGMPYSVLMPIFADRILHGGARGLGILMGATGIGALLGALTLATRTGVYGLGKWVTFSCAGFAVSLVVFAFSRSFWLSTVLLVPVGFCMMLEMSSSNTLIQAMVPDHLRGRVMSVYSMMFMGMAPFGALFGGSLADRIGAPLTVSIGAIACLGGAAIFGLQLPKLRVEARRLIVAQAMAGGEPAVEMTARVVQD